MFTVRNLLLPIFLFTAAPLSAQPGTRQLNTFTNPLLPSGADPWVVRDAGFYYYMDTTVDNLTIWKTRDITDLAHAEKKIVWTPPPGTPYSKEIWAPELHRLGGKWYIYFGADDGINLHHRLWVLENSSPDPLSGNMADQGNA